MNRMVSQNKDKKYLIMFVIVFAIALLIFIWIFVSINNKFKAASDLGLLTINSEESLVPNNVASTSFSKDKTINEVINKASQLINGKTANVTASSSETVEETKKENEAIQTVMQEDNTETEEEKKELAFIAPAVGEIITDYADESLVYSKTLDEWTTHLGIDIKANKTSSVVASEDGIVKSIKSDPRYGLTVIIEHDDGYETLYANLLSADFVKEGDSVKKNQAIGTVGESASFEVSDPPHLHFEILQNGENLNPTTIIK